MADFNLLKIFGLGDCEKPLLSVPRLVAQWRLNRGDAQALKALVRAQQCEIRAEAKRQQQRKAA